MNIEEAKKILHHETFDDNGIFLLLRAGEDPGEAQILRLRLALRVLWRELMALEVLPRSIAFACGMIIHFSSECRSNIESNTTLSEALRRSLDICVQDLVMGAFDVLAGREALSWSIVRPDLGETRKGE